MRKRSRKYPGFSYVSPVVYALAGMEHLGTREAIAEACGSFPTVEEIEARIAEIRKMPRISKPAFDEALTLVQLRDAIDLGGVASLAVSREVVRACLTRIDALPGGRFGNEGEA